MAEEERPLLSTGQILAHNSPSDCWIVVDDQVWDMSDFAPEHPGGPDSTYGVPYLPLTFVSHANA